MIAALRTYAGYHKNAARIDAAIDAIDQARYALNYLGAYNACRGKLPTSGRPLVVESSAHLLRARAEIEWLLSQIDTQAAALDRQTTP